MDSLGVTLWRDYVEDERISMEVYADSLAKAMATHFPGRCHLTEFVPTLPNRLKASLWGMRLARFTHYPWQVRRHSGQINHIVEQGYGHLLFMLDPRHAVVTVHDLIVWLTWRGDIPGVARGKKPFLSILSFSALRRARHLIADSESTRRDLIRLLKIPDSRISVIYPGIAENFRPFAPEEKIKAGAVLGLDGGDIKRVLVTGPQFYKNHTTAVKAFAKLRTMSSQPLELIKLGAPTPEFKAAVQQQGVEDCTRYMVGISGSQLPALYNSIDILLFPSLYEGFGWPPLEAMACGTPVVASNAASLPEVIGDAGLMCAPFDHDGLARTMHALLTDRALRLTCIDRGLNQATRFTWERVAYQTFEVYQRVAES
jgi:glycosyltransferase involved in cell wall biosynthesis